MKKIVIGFILGLICGVILTMSASSALAYDLNAGVRNAKNSQGGQNMVLKKTKIENKTSNKNASKIEKLLKSIEYRLKRLERNK